MTEPVDVLIIGAGASGAAVAWSLAETRMKILCLEQGDWMNPSELPQHRPRLGSATAERLRTPIPTAARAPPTIRSTTTNSPIQVVNFNGVGGGTILYAGHFPRFHPSDFRVRTLDGVADDWPIDYATLEPFYDENDRMMGVSGLAGDPGLSAARTHDAAAAAGQVRHSARARPEQARLALVAVRQRDRVGGLRRPRELHQPGRTAPPAARRAPRPAPTSPTGPPRSAPAWNCAPAAACARSPPTSTAWRPAWCITTPTGGSSSSRRKW